MECSHPDQDASTDAASRAERMKHFPFSVMLKVSYPELDFANRWCWQNLGPCDGDCTQAHSEYQVCRESRPHSHPGTWTSFWFEKTDYNFGFNEWYFSDAADRDKFIAILPEINWGENYAK